MQQERLFEVILISVFQLQPSCVRRCANLERLCKSEALHPSPWRDQHVTTFSGWGFSSQGKTFQVNLAVKKPWRSCLCRKLTPWPCRGKFSLWHQSWYDRKHWLQCKCMQETFASFLDHCHLRAFCVHHFFGVQRNPECLDIVLAVETTSGEGKECSVDVFAFCGLSRKAVSHRILALLKRSIWSQLIVVKGLGELHLETDFCCYFVPLNCKVSWLSHLPNPRFDSAAKVDRFGDKSPRGFPSCFLFFAHFACKNGFQLFLCFSRKVSLIKMCSEQTATPYLCVNAMRNTKCDLFQWKSSPVKWSGHECRGHAESCLYNKWYRCHSWHCGSGVFFPIGSFTSIMWAWNSSTLFKHLSWSATMK